MGKLIRCLGLALAALVCPLAPAQADYPSAAVKIIVANTPGTAGDNLVRILAARLSEVMGKQFYVVNHAGAGGTIGAEIAARSTPDGYTILAISTPLQVIAPHLYKNLKYKPIEDFTPLMTYAKTDNVMVTNPSLPVQSVQDVIAHAKANPGKLKLSNAGLGFQSHLANVMFANRVGIDVLHVPYRGAASMTGVMSGEADLTISPVPATIQFIRAGRVKPIAVTSLTRSPVVPELPTMHESGVPNFEASGWNGFMMPKGTPPEIIAKLREELTKVLAEEPVREQLRRQGGEPWAISGDEMAKFIQQEYDRYGEVVRVANIKLE